MHDDLTLDVIPTRLTYHGSAHRFSDATLPKNTWRIQGIVERTLWMKMHLDRDPGFSQRIKEYEEKMKRSIPRAGDSVKFASLYL